VQMRRSLSAEDAQNLGTLDPAAIAKAQGFAHQAHTLNAVDFLLNIIPKNFFGAFSEGDLLQVLLVAVLTAFAIGALGERGKPSLWITLTDKTVLPTHLAFRTDRARVDAFHAAALAAGGVDNGPPGLRADYHPHYYAAFVIDPEGNNIEVVCHDPPGARRLAPERPARAAASPRRPAKKVKKPARKPAKKAAAKTKKRR